MSAFKEAVNADIDDVFLFLDEFAETHNLNGIEAVCIVESPTATEKFLTTGKYDGFEAVRGLTAIIHVRAADIGELPTEGQRFTLDGKICKVFSCVNHAGMLTIALHANISNTQGWAF